MKTRKPRTDLDSFTVLDERDNIKAEDQPDRSGPWILFPEIIGFSVIALLLPLPLVHLLISGHVVYGIAGLLLWLISVGFTVHFIRRRHYWLVYLPMVAIGGLFFIVYRLCQ